jgi:chloramphenicol O-acetyltransferase
MLSSFLTPTPPLFLDLTILASETSYLDFFQQQSQKISKKTFNPLLVQDYQPPAMEPEACDTYIPWWQRSSLSQKDFDAPIRQEPV